MDDIHQQTLVVLPSSYWIATLENFGRKWVGLPALLVIINDTMAYVFGKTMGRHPILSVISPSKTWEGFIGAALSTIGASYFLLESRRDALVLGLGVSIIGPFGGFLASLIKRAYSEKDFGTLFQGHGGFVDRLDCQMILAPLVFLYLSLTQQRQ
jgi:phosphatidate cytidylyltransferase